MLKYLNINVDEVHHEGEEVVEKKIVSNNKKKIKERGRVEKKMSKYKFNYHVQSSKKNGLKVLPIISEMAVDQAMR